MTDKEPKTRYFRAGAAAVIYNSKDQVVIFKRLAHPVGEWQFVQGGIDDGEEPEETLWRELYEETGIEQQNVEKVTEYPDWLSYTYKVTPPTDVSGREKTVARELSEKDRLRIGQTHRWFFLKLKDGYEIDLSRAPEDEFSEYKWIDPKDAVGMTWKMKGNVYKRLVDYLCQKVL